MNYPHCRRLVFRKQVELRELRKEPPVAEENVTRVSADWIVEQRRRSAFEGEANIPMELAVSNPTFGWFQLFSEIKPREVPMLVRSIR
jgi:hypothetical protein